MATFTVYSDGSIRHDDERRKLARLKANLRRAQTIHDREQERGRSDMSVLQTRRMYFASMALMRALGEWQRERISVQMHERLLNRPDGA